MTTRTGFHNVPAAYFKETTQLVLEVPGRYCAALLNVFTRVPTISFGKCWQRVSGYPTDRKELRSAIASHIRSGIPQSFPGEGGASSNEYWKENSWETTRNPQQVATPHEGVKSCIPGALVTIYHPTNLRRIEFPSDGVWFMDTPWVPQTTAPPQLHWEYYTTIETTKKLEFLKLQKNVYFENLRGAITVKTSRTLLWF